LTGLRLIDGIRNLLKTPDSRSPITTFGDKLHGNDALELKVAFINRHYIAIPLLTKRMRKDIIGRALSSKLKKSSKKKFLKKKIEFLS